MFTVGGTELYIHKYLGPKSPEEGTADQPIYSNLKETNIQDLLFLENRDRVYDSSIYRIKGVYSVQDIDFNLSQFGLFIDNDTVYMTVHINDYIRTVGRKPLSGDVIEVPHLKDEFALNDFDVSLPRYFVISDVGRASEGFSATWYPHIYRLKLTKIAHSQQYADIFNKPIVDPLTGLETDRTLADILSTQNKSLELNDLLITQAEIDAPLSGYETQHFYNLDLSQSGDAVLTVDELSTCPVMPRPGYTGYLLGDGIPANGAAFGHGITFPGSPVKDDYFLRTDFLPNRLFKYDGTRWIKQEDAVRTSMTPSATRDTQKGTFINNTKRTGVDLLEADIIRLNGNTTIQLNTAYTAELFVTLTVVSNGYTVAANIEDNSGTASIVIPTEIYEIGNELVDYKLYKTSMEERQALSKALRIKKPLADI